MSDIANGEKLEVGQALFGNSGGQMALLAQSGLYDSQLHIAADLPEPLPVDYEPPPFYSIRRFGEIMAFYKTALDPAAPRDGMVRTHVLVLPLGIASALASISPIFDALDPSVDLEEIQMKTVVVNTDQSSTGVDGAEALLAALLSRFQHVGEPIVWIGLESFPLAFCEAWRKLPRVVRASVTVRLAMKPQNVYDRDRGAETTSILTVPKSLASRWGNSEVLGPDAPPTQRTPLFSYLIGEESTLGDLLGALGVDLEKISSFDGLDVAADMYHRLISGTGLSLDELLYLGELGGRFVPDLPADRPFKMEVCDALTEAASKEGKDVIRHLRNFDPAACIRGRAVLDAGANAWVTRALSTPPRDDDAKTAHLAFTSQNEEWNDAMKRALRRGLRDPAASGIVLHWFRVERGLIRYVGGLVPNANEQEDSFVKALTPQDDLAAITQWARTKKWPVLYARAVELAGGADEALLAVLSFKGGRVDLALRQLIRSATPPAVVSSAVESGNAGLLGAAVPLCLHNPALLRSLDLTEQRSQRLWVETVQERGSLSEVDERLLEELLADSTEARTLPVDVLGDLFEAGGLNLLDNQLPSSALDRLSPQIRNGVFERTAIAWIRRFRSWAVGNGTPPPHPDHETGRFIVAHHPIHNVVPVSAGLNPTVWLFQTLRGYSEDDFVRAVQIVLPANRRPSPHDANALGRIVYANRWKSAASKICEYKNEYPEYLSAYQIVAPLCTWLERTIDWAFGSTQSEKLDIDGWWRALRELCERLYPEGVQQRAVIEEAGGDIADMHLRDTSGRQQWKHVIRGLRDGEFAFGPGQLLRVIVSQYPNNREAQTMLNLFTEYIA